MLLTIVKQSAEIKEQLLFNTRLLQDLTKTHSRSLDRDRFCQQPCQLPLDTYESVLDVERKLKSKEFYSQLVRLRIFKIKMYVSKFSQFRVSVSCGTRNSAELSFRKASCQPITSAGKNYCCFRFIDCKPTFFGTEDSELTNRCPVLLSLLTEVVIGFAIVYTGCTTLPTL